MAILSLEIARFYFSSVLLVGRLPSRAKATIAPLELRLLPVCYVLSSLYLLRTIVLACTCLFFVRCFRPLSYSKLHVKITRAMIFIRGFASPPAH